jgi:hypothetical protein
MRDDCTGVYGGYGGGVRRACRVVVEETWGGRREKCDPTEVRVRAARAGWWQWWCAVRLGTRAEGCRVGVSRGKGRMSCSRYASV